MTQELRRPAGSGVTREAAVRRAQEAACWENTFAGVAAGPIPCAVSVLFNSNGKPSSSVTLANFKDAILRVADSDHQAAGLGTSWS